MNPARPLLRTVPGGTTVQFLWHPDDKDDGHRRIIRFRVRWGDGQVTEYAATPRAWRAWRDSIGSVVRYGVSGALPEAHTRSGGRPRLLGTWVGGAV